MTDPARAHERLASLLGLILCAVTLIVYAQVKDHAFVTYDDYEYVVQNPVVRSGFTVQGLVGAFVEPHASNWHPLTWLSHMLDSELFGLNPSGHHMSSLVLHLLSVVLLLHFLVQATGTLWRSFLVAALFALHPLHVESVAWVAERKDVLSGVFCMLTLIAYRRYALRPGGPIYLLTLLLYLLGLMAKPMLVTLPFLLLLLDYWPLRRLDSHRLKGSLFYEKIPFFVLAAASSVVTFLVQRGWGAVVDQVPLKERFSNAFYSYAVYLFKTFWPDPLAFHYPHPLGSIPLWQTIGCLLLVVLLTFLSIRHRRRLPFLAVGWFWYLGTLVPVIGLVQVGSHGMADRYTYIPLIGIFIALAWGTGHIVGGRPGLRPAAGVVWVCFLFALSAVTWRQAGVWKDSLTLYRHAIAVTPRNALAHNNLGNVLARQGLLQEAEHHFRRALVLNDRHAPAHNNLGIVLAKQGRVEEGIWHYGKALEIRPGFKEASLNLDLALSKSRERPRAE